MTDTSSTFLLTCTNQRKQRHQFLFHEAGSKVRYTVVSPYTHDSSGNLIYTPTELDMRRKAEILKYQNASNNFAGKKKWSYLENSTNTTSRACPEIYKLTPNTSSDVPGKPMMLYNNTTIPLYKYKPLHTDRYQHVPYDNYKRVYDIFPTTNIVSSNGTTTDITDIVILNPDSNSFAFGFTIPITITYNAIFREVSSYAINYAQLFIQHAKMNIYYSDSLIAKTDALYNEQPLISTDLIISAANITLKVENSDVGNINIQQYLGTIYIPPTNLQTVTQYVYTCKIDVTIGYSEYSLDMPEGESYRSNIDGSNITDSYPKEATSLTDVKYGTIANIDNIYTTTDISLKNAISNCSMEIYQAIVDANGDPIVDSLGNATFNTILPNNIEYIPFDISEIATS
jgi:hypothetical protein